MYATRHLTVPANADKSAVTQQIEHSIASECPLGLPRPIKWKDCVEYYTRQEAVRALDKHSKGDHPQIAVLYRDEEGKSLWLIRYGYYY